MKWAIDHYFPAYECLGPVAALVKPHSFSVNQKSPHIVVSALPCSTEVVQASGCVRDGHFLLLNPLHARVWLSQHVCSQWYTLHGFSPCHLPCCDFSAPAGMSSSSLHLVHDDMYSLWLDCLSLNPNCCWARSDSPVPVFLSAQLSALSASMLGKSVLPSLRASAAPGGTLSGLTCGNKLMCFHPC